MQRNPKTPDNGDFSWSHFVKFPKEKKILCIYICPRINSIPPQR